MTATLISPSQFQHTPHDAHSGIQVLARTVHTADGTALHTFRYLPAGRPKGLVMVVPAMGVPQSYYRCFANWLAGQGRLVVTFDFRGMGLSRKHSLKDTEATVLTWAEQDTEAVLNDLKLSAPELPLLWIGHSLGGQILPMVPSHHRVDKMITVGTGNGYWRFNSPPLKRKVWLLWFFAVPLTLPLFGYFPGNALGMVGDLPKGVMQQWRSWCLDEHYAVGVEGPAMQARFDAVRIPIVSLSFTDDEFMSEKSTDTLHALYRNADYTRTRLRPSDLGLGGIGHFGFFKAPMQQALWESQILPELL